MRMEIKVHPKRSHDHIKKNYKNLTATIIERKSPKFFVTKPYKQRTSESITGNINIQQVGVYKSG